ncbi:hypothetical protein LXL04_036012 [Taraxacum kok-saghyz]
MPSAIANPGEIKGNDGETVKGKGQYKGEHPNSSICPGGPANNPVFINTLAPMKEPRYDIANSLVTENVNKSYNLCAFKWHNNSEIILHVKVAYLVKHLGDVVGIGVFLGTTILNTSPSASTPRDKGVTSTITAAPYATASSGFRLLHNSFLPKSPCNMDWTFGILVDPPTRITSSTYDFSMFASLKHVSTVSMHLRKKPMLSSSNLARLNFIEKSIPSCKASNSIEV